MNLENQIYFWAHMLDESFHKDLISEGKHWPEDYVKTGYNLIKASPLGQQSWYSDDFIKADLKTFADEFQNLAHKNSNLGFFSSIIRWFIEYSGTDKAKYQEFIEGKLDNIIRVLQQILNDKSYDAKREQLKKLSFKDFEKIMNDILAKSQADSDEKLKSIQKRNDYELIPIYSYDEFHDKFGGNKTGYNGESEWCHANGSSTYNGEAWTNNGKNMFFVLAKNGWENVKPVKTNNAYDDYGASLIAILVDVDSNELKAETLRWNHAVHPSHTNPGASDDHAFKDNWGDLSQFVGFNVKDECQKYCANLKQNLENEAQNTNKKVEQILSQVQVIDENTIPKDLRNKITNIGIPNNVTKIGESAFSQCESLKSITIPDSITEIGAWTFYNCKSLKSITIPDSITEIGAWTFYNCKSLKSITIPNSVTKIRYNAFAYCRSLQSITIPNSVTKIGKKAFSACESLQSITIPNSVTEIGDNTFVACKSLQSITIPNSVTKIGINAFSGCKFLNSITIPNSVTEIGAGTFSECVKLQSITIPNSVIKIGESAFVACKSLQSITIPNSVTEIGAWTFEYCASLQSITIPNSVTEIREWAFSTCKSLQSITIPNSVTKIGESAFFACTSLKQVIFSSNSPLLEQIKNGEYKDWELKQDQIFIKNN